MHIMEQCRKHAGPKHCPPLQAPLSLETGMVVVCVSARCIIAAQVVAQSQEVLQLLLPHIGCFTQELQFYAAC